MQKVAAASRHMDHDMPPSCQAFQVPRQAAAQQPNSQGVEGLPFEGNSSYRDQYGAKAVPYSRVKPPVDYQPNKVDNNYNN
jgi:hypothetical protein